MRSLCPWPWSSWELGTQTAVQSQQSRPHWGPPALLGEPVVSAFTLSRFKGLKFFYTIVCGNWKDNYPTL